jgi:hypothetical protein
MTVGIPGTGIGGLFYLAQALMLPVRGVFRRRRRERVVWRRAFGPAAIALGVLGGLWLSGALLAVLLVHVLGPAFRGAGPASLAHHSNVLRVASLLAGIGTLCLVLTGVQVARLTVTRPAPMRRR